MTTDRDEPDRVKQARHELIGAITRFDMMPGKEPCVRLANAIEDMIDARVAAASLKENHRD